MDAAVCQRESVIAAADSGVVLPLEVSVYALLVVAVQSDHDGRDRTPGLPTSVVLGGLRDRIAHLERGRLLRVLLRWKAGGFSSIQSPSSWQVLKKFSTRLVKSSTSRAFPA